jgi:NADPH:quinone reductase-like Zn-dependent oxidoreductase
MDSCGVVDRALNTSAIMAALNLNAGRSEDRRAGEALIINGATGAYSGAAVLVALAMGTSRVVAAGRKKEMLDQITKAGGSRVCPVVLSGDVEQDAAALRNASSGVPGVRHG